MPPQDPQKKWELAEFDPIDQGIDRLAEEINILRLEGSVFCFDRREAKKRKGPITINEIKKQPVTIQPHPDYGQPSVLAYRVLQAVFLKMTMEGYPYPDTVSFSQRELARLADRTWGGRTSKQLFEAVMQLRATLVHCALYDKELDTWQVANISIFVRSLFSGKGNTINACVVQIDPAIAKSLNRRHVAFFNLQRLNTLDVIGMVLYKRLFFHLSNIYRPRKTQKEELVFCKDYEDICREWLGGLKPHRHKSLILRDQLGPHLEALKRTGLIRRCDIEKKADGSGFKLSFFPARGFFDDHEAYYLERQQPRFRFKQTTDLLDIQRPIEVVAYFHELMGHSQITFDEKEVAYATQLLKAHSVAEVRDLVAYAVEGARETNFKMQFFGAVSQYRERWQNDRARRAARERAQEAIKACSYCNEQGMMAVKNRTGAFAVCLCPHDIGKITALEERQQLRRV